MSSPTAWWRARGRPTKCSPRRTRTCTSSCTRSPTGRSRFTIPAGRSAMISGSGAQPDRRGKPRPRRSTVTAPPSIDPDVLLADDLAPPGGFGLDELGEPLGGARDDVSALQGKLVFHFLHCEEVDQGFVELFDDRTRRARRRDQPDPGGRFETRVKLGDRREIGILRRAPPPARGKADELARLDVLPDRAARLDQHHLDRAGHQVVDRGAAALVVDRIDLDAGSFLEELESETAGGGGTRRAEVHPQAVRDRKSTRLNSSHGYISYAVFCLKKKKRKVFSEATDIQKKGKKTTTPP